MQVAVLGFGSQGLSSFEYWTKLGHDVTICDRNSDIVIPDGVATQIGDNYLDGLDKYDLIIRSPSIHPDEIKAANSPSILDKVWSNTNEFFKVCPTKNIIGVTGTKGKGTTSTLIAEMLKAAGKTVHLGGNIGTPPLELLKENIQPDDWVVLELANFQLIDIKHSPAIAVCLMFVPEHQDWHHSVEEYLEAKQQLFRWQKAGDIAIFYSENEQSKEIASVSTGHKVPYYSPPGAFVEDNQIKIEETVICSTEEIGLLGKHNWQNVCAAVTAVWQITKDHEAISSVIKSFKGMEFRLELIRELGGVKYYNDSFGTTPETAIVAIEAFSEPKVVILGGSDKGASFDALARTVAENNVRQAIVIGETGAAIKESLHKAGFDAVVEGAPTMQNVVAQATKAAQPGDIVLLSTGCASFGMFKNYKDRGDQFNQAVRALD
jgi:UDP-N-acetylmuramoylalanine--D-glutamate ligase